MDVSPSLRRRFRAQVLAAVRRIPAGRVATYGDIAALAGAPGAARAVGNILRDCQDPGMPCHRVIAAGGRLGGWGGPVEIKRARLRYEGLRVDLTRVQEFATVRWVPDRRDAPTGRRRAAGPR
jgi:methylated-DNA-[protein]-cysteine S-methyltransferase